MCRKYCSRLSHSKGSGGGVDKFTWSRKEFIGRLLSYGHCIWWKFVLDTSFWKELMFKFCYILFYCNYFNEFLTHNICLNNNKSTYLLKHEKESSNEISSFYLMLFEGTAHSHAWANYQPTLEDVKKNWHL